MCCDFQIRREAKRRINWTSETVRDACKRSWAVGRASRKSAERNKAAPRSLTTFPECLQNFRIFRGQPNNSLLRSPVMNSPRWLPVIPQGLLSTPLSTLKVNNQKNLGMRSCCDVLSVLSSHLVSTVKERFSGARVFAVYAEFPEGEAAPYPLPYFAKIHSCKHILKEYEAYDRFVSRYVPFSQRPNCEPKRCFLGLTDGILVGDFVDNSESLADVVQPNGARGIIHSLFDDALRGWRQQAYYREERISLSDVRANILKPERIKSVHVKAAKTFGATMSPYELTLLLDESAKHLYRRGPVHGDLNTQNIRVRNGEAVLIDFYKSNIGPLVADLASLEIAICFSMEADASWNLEDQKAYEDSSRFNEWRRHIDTLFKFVANKFGMVPPLQEQPCAHDWMWSACRQLRLMAHYIEPNEGAYGSLLGAYLLRMAMFPDDEKRIEPHTPDAVVRASHIGPQSAFCVLSPLRKKQHEDL